MGIYITLDKDHQILFLSKGIAREHSTVNVAIAAAAIKIFIGLAVLTMQFVIQCSAISDSCWNGVSYTALRMMLTAA
jgi:hypothetical protein